MVNGKDVSEEINNNNAKLESDKEDNYRLLSTDSDSKDIKDNTIKKTKKTKQASLADFNFIIKSPNENFVHLKPLPNNIDLRIYSWNVNGLKATINKGLFEQFIKQGKLIITIQKTLTFFVSAKLKSLREI